MTHIKTYVKCKYAVAIFCICAVLALSSCSYFGGGSSTATGSGIEAKPMAVPAVAEAELYIIGKYVDMWSEEKYSTIINKDGGLVMRGASLEIVYNSENNAAIAIKQRKYGKDGRYKTAMFDVAGNMIYDFELCDYYGDEDSLVRRYDLEKPEESSDPPMGPLYGTGSRYILIDMTSGLPISGVQEGVPYGEREDSQKYYDHDDYEYFDGSVGIKHDEEKGTYDLVDDNGKVLFDGADKMEPLILGSTGKIQLFLAVKTKTMYKLSRSGSIEAEYKISDKDSAYRLDGTHEFSFSREIDEENYIQGKEYEGIEVETIPSLADEWSFEGCHYFNNNEVAYIVVYRSIVTSDDDEDIDILDRYYDVFDTDGKMVWHDLRPTTSDFTIGPGRIAMRQGLTQGLIDESGKWLYKESVFSTLVD